jgi:hypothetical protein
MGTKTRESISGSSVRAAAQRARDARKNVDTLACEAWTKRLLGFRGPAQPSPMMADALNAGYRYLEIRCAACDVHSTNLTSGAQRTRHPFMKLSGPCDEKTARK